MSHELSSIPVERAQLCMLLPSVQLLAIAVGR